MAEGSAVEPAPSDPANTSNGSVRTAIGGGGQEASVAAVTQAYSNYVQELQSAFEGIRQRAASLQETGPQQLSDLQNQLQPQTQELIQAVTETQAPISTGTGSIVGICGWSTVLLATASLASLLGAYVATPILGVFLGRFGAGIIAFAAIPIASFYYIRAKEQSGAADAELRFQLLSISALQGLLAGHALAYTYLSAQPFTFVAPLVIAFAYPLVAAQVGGQRIPLLGGALGASLGALLLLGAIGGVLTTSYLLLAVLYTGAAGAVLQIAFRNVQSNTVQVHLYQLAMLSATLLAKGLVFGLFGSNAPIDQNTR